MDRQQSIQRLRQRTTAWDMIVIGGGATGVGVALDAAARGLDVLLLEQSDFGKGTSSRSTKLVHGGVRYLRQGNVALVRDALHERTNLFNNAPHLVFSRRFLIPCRSKRQQLFYRTGLKLYDFLAGRHGFGRSKAVSAEIARSLVATLRPEIASSGVIYYDGQFDDSRLLIHMAQTAEDQGACLVNYMAVTDVIATSAGRAGGVVAKDAETGAELSVSANCIVNAAGPFCDAVRRLDQPDSRPLLTASQGVHIVLPQRFLPGDTAMIVPKTADGRVLFIIPWHKHALVGTTDTPIESVSLEPTARQQEIRFLLDTAAEYLTDRPTVADIQSVFTGIRPLVRDDTSQRTASLSRDHLIDVSPSGLITITGGKWTTVRQMAEDCVDRAIAEAGLPATPCRTRTLHLHGFRDPPTSGISIAPARACYGSDLSQIEALEQQSPELSRPLHEDLTIRGSEVIWAARREMARTVEDVLARRTRCLFLNARASLQIALQVARLLAAELGLPDSWCESQVADFRSVAEHYLPDSFA